jgi:hypothetical protein
MLASLRRRSALRIPLLVLLGTGGFASLFATGAHASAQHTTCTAQADDDHSASHGSSHLEHDAAAPESGGPSWRPAEDGGAGCPHCAPTCNTAGHCGGLAGVVLPAAEGSGLGDATLAQRDAADRLRSLTVPPPTPPPHSGSWFRRP